MFWSSDSDKPWFAPKRFGLGTGLPIAWQGWLFMGLHIALIVGLSIWTQHRPGLMLATVVPAALLPLPIYAAKTRGGWSWRWGGDE